jgi:hypothetical protein
LSVRSWTAAGFPEIGCFERNKAETGTIIPII